jgi:membrane protein
MNRRVARTLTLGRAVVREARAEKLTFMAGSIAYHAFVSLLPLLLLMLAAVAAVGNRTLEAALIQLTLAVLTPGASDVLVAELRATSGSAGLSVFGLLVLLWGTLRIFRGLDTAFSDIYESETANTFLDQLGDGLLVLLTFGVALVAAGLLENALPSGDGAATWLLHRAVLVVGLAVTFYPMYYVFPDSDVTPLEVVPGVLVAAVGLTAFEALFRLYVEFSTQQPTQSTLAGILVFLTFLYFSGLVILLGAVVNAVLSNRSKDVSVRPVFGGVDPDERPSASSQAAVLTAVRRLDATLVDADEVVVTVDGARVSLPPPDAVAADTDRSGLIEGDVRLELRWTSRDDDPAE